MKKITVLLAFIGCLLLVISGYTPGNKAQDIKLYYVDSSMQRLIPTSASIKASNPDTAAKEALDMLVNGMKNNPKIMRIMPDVKKGLTVRVKNKTAYVNMSSEFVSEHSDARQHELLTIYSIVNSLTSIDGIVNVKFTIDNKEQKDFKGFCDMRETFIPDYYV